MAGVQGNGQTELCEALIGIRPVTAGSVLLDGKDLTHATPRDRLRAGFGYVPEDRQEDGLVPDFSVAENLVLDVYDRPPFASGVALDLDAIRANATRRVDEFDIRTTSVERPVGTLSGGNQQKVILARELSRDIRLLLASQPTRGLDVGSIEFVHRRIVEERDRGRRGAHRLLRAGRDLRARRPDRRHVRGKDRRIPAAHRTGGRTGPAHGRSGGEATSASEDAISAADGATGSSGGVPAAAGQRRQCQRRRGQRPGPAGCPGRAIRSQRADCGTIMSEPTPPSGAPGGPPTART